MSCTKSSNSSAAGTEVPGLVAQVSQPAVSQGSNLPALITAGVLAVSAVVLFCFNPSFHGFYPQCTFHHATGLLCPGCGSLRALHQLLHGHVVTAFHYNALLITALPFIGWFALRRYLLKPKQPPVIARARASWWLWVGLVVVVVFGVVRNLPYESLACLRP